jgi:hypothetical protein
MTGSSLPTCYGREWSSTDPGCQSKCDAQKMCAPIFATRRLDEAATKLGGSSPQSVPLEKLAAECGTDVASIEAALAARFALVPPSSQPAKTPAPSAPGAPGPSAPSSASSTEPGPLQVAGAPSATTTTTDSAPSSPKRRGRPAGAKNKAKADGSEPPPPLPAVGPSTPASSPASAPSSATGTASAALERPGSKLVIDCPTCNGAGHHACATCRGEGLVTPARFHEVMGYHPQLPKMRVVSDEPEASAVVETPKPAPPPARSSGPGFLINVTTGTVEHADWPGFPPLFLTPDESAPVLQLTFWSVPLGAWVQLVAEPSGRPATPGLVEMTWAQIVRAGFAQKMGADVASALRSVLPGL